MKYVVLALCFAAALAVVSAAGKSCKHKDDCEEGECCVRKGFFGRRKCAELATEGKPCTKSESATYHRFNCPCDEGMKCEKKNWWQNHCVKNDEDGDGGDDKEGDGGDEREGDGGNEGEDGGGDVREGDGEEGDGEEK
uniref:U75-Liphistoxin-Lsp1a_1 n=1 Tax=Liphistius sp. SGP-2016 TaxID=1905180 RepID=A0A4Q8K2P0_9ARAC